MNDDLQDKLTLLLKSEKTLLRLEMRKKVRQVILIFIALIALLVALSALNVALYFYLSTLFTPIYSALSLAGVNIFLSLILFFIAANLSLGEDEKSAYEIRDFARNQVRREVDEVRDNIFNTRSIISNLFSFKRAVYLISLFKKAKS